MMISSCVYNEIIYKCSSIFAETGGIIGGNNNVINKFLFDKGVEIIIPGYYIPDVDLLNFNLYKWRKRGIKFYGIVHSHINEYQDLSSIDKNFIRKILITMPQDIEMLYFPIVSNKLIYSYKAIRNHDEICINDDDVILI